MRALIRSKNFYIMLLLDGSLITAAYLLSHLLRFEGKIPPQEWINFKATLPYVAIFKPFIFYLFDLYRGMWRYTSLVDLLNVLKATITSSEQKILLRRGTICHDFYG